MDSRMGMGPGMDPQLDSEEGLMSLGERRPGGSRGGNPRDRGNPRDKWGDNRGNRGPPPRYDYVKEQLAFMQGPTTNLETREDEAPRKFTGRCRLFVGNLPHSITEDEFRSMFEAYGEVAEVFLNNQKGFGFVKLDTRQNAEAAKAALDFTQKDGKYLRVRFATHGAALKVKNLSPWVSNELLEASFSIFGDVERAVVIVDDRGRPVGEGIVEFARKQAAAAALKRCTEECFLLTSSPRPVMVEPLEQRDIEDGLPEINFQTSNKQYMKERDMGPRLAEPGTFEFEFAQRWKKLYDIEKQKRADLDKSIVEGRRQLEEQMEFYLYEHEARLLREKLRMMEEQSNILARERELRREEDRRREEQRRQEEMLLRQQQEEILRRRGDDMHYRQEDTLLQEAALRQMQSGGDIGVGSTGGRMGGYDVGYDSVPGGPGYDSIPAGPGGGASGGIAARQSRFDQPPQGMQGYQSPGMLPDEPAIGGSIGGMNGMRGGAREIRGMSREMMEQDDYGMDAKRRRY